MPYFGILSQNNVTYITISTHKSIHIFAFRLKKRTKLVIKTYKNVI